MSPKISWIRLRLAAAAVAAAAWSIIACHSAITRDPITERSLPERSADMEPWLVLTDPESDTVGAAAKLYIAISESMKTLDLDDRDGLNSLVEALVLYLVDPSPEAMLHYRAVLVSSGASLDRKRCIALCEQNDRWFGLTCSSDRDEFKDEQLFLDINASRTQRFMNLLSVSAAVGTSRRSFLSLPSPDWPFPGANASAALHVPLDDLDQATIEREQDGPRCASFTLAVQFGDGSAGLLRVNLFRFDSGWLPITFGVASESTEKWPWPAG